MFHRLQAQVGGDAKRSFVGTHQPSYIDQYRNDSKQHRHPAVMGQVLRMAEIRRDLQHFPDDFPDIVEGH